MEAVVPFRIVGTVIGDKLLESVIFFILPSLVCFVTDFFLISAPFAFAVEASYFLTVLMDYATLLCTVERFRLFLL